MVLLFVLLIGSTQLEFILIKSELQILFFLPLSKWVASSRGSTIIFFSRNIVSVEFISERQGISLKVRVMPLGACFCSHVVGVSKQKFCKTKKSYGIIIYMLRRHIWSIVLKKAVYRLIQIDLVFCMFVFFIIMLLLGFWLFMLYML